MRLIGALPRAPPHPPPPWLTFLFRFPQRSDGRVQGVLCRLRRGDLPFLALRADPGVCLVCHFGDQQEVVPTETVGRFPFIAFLVEKAARGVVTPACFGFIWQL